MEVDFNGDLLRRLTGVHIKVGEKNVYCHWDETKNGELEIVVSAPDGRDSGAPKLKLVVDEKEGKKQAE